MDDTLIKSLQNQSVYPHETTEISMQQTHISWVLLTGLWAYKIKKPVDYGFCDFTTLEKRKHFCELEVKLNKQLAPEIYEEVVAITGTPTEPEINGAGPVIDYAIKMHQFDNRQLLSKVHQTEGLSRALLISIANQVAAFHEAAQVVPTSEPYGSPEQVWAPMADNFEALKQLEPSKGYAAQIDQIAQWAEQTYHKLTPLLAQRKASGFIKECHGDMHLGNIVLHQGKPVVFDCIEFNQDFRCIDTVNDMAFLAMDLDEKGYPELAHFFSNRYFERTQDIEGIQLLQFYKSYRAMVRAKVCALTIPNVDESTAKALTKEMTNFISLAVAYCEAQQPQLTITFGPSGCGKSHFTDELLLKQRAFRLRSDVLRKQMAGLDPFQNAPEAMRAKLYAEDFTKQVYNALAQQAKQLLQANVPVIVDATFLKSWQRDMFLALSQSLDIPFKILTFDRDPELLKSRLKTRQQSDKTSDADSTVLEKQLNWLEPLTALEEKLAEKVT